MIMHRNLGTVSEFQSCYCHLTVCWNSLTVPKLLTEHPLEVVFVIKDSDDVNRHRENELKALAMDRWIATRLEEDPSLLDQARRTLKRWESDQSAPAACLREWSEILDQPLSEIVTLLRRDDEEACRLRQSSPFCGILPRKVRTRILLSKPEGLHEPATA